MPQYQESKQLKGQLLFLCEKAKQRTLRLIKLYIIQRMLGSAQKYTITTSFLHFVFLIAVVVRLSESQTTINGFMPAGSNGDMQIYNLTGYNANDLLRIKFVATTNPAMLTTAALMVNFNSPLRPEDKSITDFYHVNPKDVDSYDLDAIWNARQQFINIAIPPGAVTAYFTILNYDPSYRSINVSYTMYIDGPGQINYQCDTCANNEHFGGPSGCFCQNCMFENFGKLCSRTSQVIDKNSTSVRLLPQVYNYFSLSNTNKITLQIQAQGIAQAYLQFQQFDYQVASFYNVARGTQADGRYLVNNNKIKIVADTQKRKLLITLVSFSNNPINATITYTQDSSVSVLVIVMAVLGGVLLITLIVAVVCIVKKRNAANRINSQMNIPSDTNKLSGEQIQRYFPCCVYSHLLANNDQFQTSLNKLNAGQPGDPPTQKIKQQQPTTESDCVICLQQINQTDQVRIGYCKHIFHGTCLISWFKKQRNCPYCRKQYTREQTTAEYGKLIAENGNRVLKDDELAKAIFNRKIMSKTVIENIQ